MPKKMDTKSVDMDYNTESNKQNTTGHFNRGLALGLTQSCCCFLIVGNIRIFLSILILPRLCFCHWVKMSFATVAVSQQGACVNI